MKRIVLTLLVVATFLPSLAHAVVRVRNFDDVPHEVTFDFIGDDDMTVIIQPNQSKMVVSSTIKVHVKGGNSARARTGTEYIIKNGSLIINRRNIGGIDRH